MNTARHLNYELDMVPVLDQRPPPVDMRERDALLVILHQTAKQSPQMRVIIDKILFQYRTGAALRGVSS